MYYCIINVYITVLLMCLYVLYVLLYMFICITCIINVSGLYAYMLICITSYIINNVGSNLLVCQATVRIDERQL